MGEGGLRSLSRSNRNSGRKGEAETDGKKKCVKISKSGKEDVRVHVHLYVCVYVCVYLCVCMYGCTCAGSSKKSQIRAKVDEGQVLARVSMWIDTYRYILHVHMYRDMCVCA